MCNEFYGPKLYCYYFSSWPVQMPARHSHSGGACRADVALFLRFVQYSAMHKFVMHEEYVTTELLSVINKIKAVECHQRLLFLFHDKLKQGFLLAQGRKKCTRVRRKKSFLVAIGWAQEKNRNFIQKLITGNM
ncbi:MAG: hypothetical protein JWQ09_29 [Segetibacter sp.]|nr:hypothetical protein [Segetibacter sp.]